MVPQVVVPELLLYDRLGEDVTIWLERNDPRPRLAARFPADPQVRLLALFCDTHAEPAGLWLFWYSTPESLRQFPPTGLDGCRGLFFEVPIEAIRDRITTLDRKAIP